MAERINRAIELLESGQPIYYVGGHTGHVLTHEQGAEDAKTWADYINVGMEHGAFDMTGLGAYMSGLVAGGPTASGHRTPTKNTAKPSNVERYVGSRWGVTLDSARTSCPPVSRTRRSAR